MKSSRCADCRSLRCGGTGCRGMRKPEAGRTADFSAALAGNPNCGKTTLFNALTGGRMRTGNWPGVTVERRDGLFRGDGFTAAICDLPGIYDIRSPLAEEKAAREFIAGDECDVIINIADAASLERSLFLTLNLLSLGKGMILAVNMTDTLKKRGLSLDCRRLSALLGIPVIPICALSGDGLGLLTEAARREARSVSPPPARTFADDAEAYAFISSILDQCLSGEDSAKARTDRADRVLCHPVLGRVFFILIMSAVFALTFLLGDRAKSLLAASFAALSELIRAAFGGGTGVFTVDLVCDGIIPGVGAAASFFPVLFILFFLLGILEDCGYMARCAYLSDSLMQKCALSGREFIVLLLGFGCTVGAVASSRTAGSERGRRRLILALPYISCSARLPVLAVFSSAFFGKYAWFAVIALYLLGICVSLAVLRLSSGIRGGDALLIEMPDYRTPIVRNVFRTALRRSGAYVGKAGSVILAASALLWFILNFGAGGRAASAEESFGGAIGTILSPLLCGAGLGFWQITLALAAGFFAKEIVVSSCAVIFGLCEVSPASLAAALGSIEFTTANAAAAVVFILLYPPCVSCCAAIFSETSSAKLTFGVCALSLAIAYGAAALTHALFSLFA